MSDQLKDLRKLCILNAKETETDDDIRNVCEEFGQLVGFNRPPNNRRLAFPLFKSPSDAEVAKEGLQKKGYRVDYAKAKPSPGIGDDGDRVKREEFRSTRTVNGGSNGNSGHGVGSENGDDHSAHDINDNRPYGKCLKCGDRSYYNCGRCGDFYCSEECQASDWLVHKRNCFPMPKLKPSKSCQSLFLGKSMEKLRMNDSPPRTAAAAAVKSADAADGHEATPTRASPAPVPSPEKPIVEDIKPIIKAEPKPKPAKPASVQSIEQSPNSDYSCSSPRQKIVLSPCGGSEQSSSAVINRTVSESIPNNAEVWITHVRNYQTVYVRAVANDDAYMKMINDVANAASTAPNLKMYPYPREDYVLAPFDGSYYRGLVLSCDENAGKVRIGYVDFGNSQEVPFSTLKQLPTELKELPRLTFIVKLKGLKDEPEPNELDIMKDHLERISETGSAQILKIVGDRPQIEGNDAVELINVVSNSSVNDHLNSLVQKRYYVSDLTQKVLKTDPSNVPILIAIDTQRVDNNMMTCMCKEDVGLFMGHDEKTQTYGDAVKNAPAYQPKKKELCVVRIKEQEGYAWYRAMYQTDLVDDRAQVYCIDYGKIDVVRANNIRAMSRELEHEITSFVCYIKNGDSIKADKRMQFFNEHSEFKPTSIEFDTANNQHVVTMNFSGAQPASQ